MMRNIQNIVNFGQQKINIYSTLRNKKVISYNLWRDIKIKL